MRGLRQSPEKVFRAFAEAWSQPLLPLEVTCRFGVSLLDATPAWRTRFAAMSETLSPQETVGALPLNRLSGCVEIPETFHHLTMGFYGLRNLFISQDFPPFPALPLAEELVVVLALLYEP